MGRNVVTGVGRANDVDSKIWVQSDFACFCVFLWYFAWFAWFAWYLQVSLTWYGVYSLGFMGWDGLK